MSDIGITRNLPKGKKGFTVSFRHPVVKDKSGKYGLKVHRSLKTDNETVADNLIAELQRLANDETWWSLSRRSEAYNHFSEIIVDTFYDPMEAETPNEATLLDKIELPGKAEGYFRTTLLGPSGVGKTSLLRMLAGTTKDKFPTTSSGRTTTCNMELIMSPDDTYELVATFMSRHVTEMYVQECIEAALQYCIEHPDNYDRQTVSEKLLTHKDLIVRLAYILGDYSLRPQDSTSEEFDDESEDNDDAGSPENITDLLSVIDEFVDEVILIAHNKLENHTDFDTEEYSPEDDSDVLFLRDEMVNEIAKRFSLLKGGEKINSRGDWVNGWYFKSTNRSEFLKIAKLFSSNEKKKWGSLLTPIVKTLRIKGDFKPSFGEIQTKMVLFDGQGLGHKTTATSIPNELVKYFELSDSIILVDNAQAPMLDNVKLALRTVIDYGYSNKVIFAFTHVDLMNGENFSNFDDKKRHIIAALESYLTDLKHQNEAILAGSEAESIIKSCFFFSYIDKETVNKRTQSNATAMLMHLKELFCTSITCDDVKLKYDTMTLYMHLQMAINNYRDAWAGVIRAEHWSRIKALTRRLAYFKIDNYNHELAPVSDFRQELSRQLNLFMNKPLAILPSEASEQVKVAMISKIKGDINAQLVEFTEMALWKEKDQMGRWQEAYGYRGRYSTDQRISKINNIFEMGAPRIENYAYDLTDSQKRCITAVIRIVKEALKKYDSTLENFNYGDSFN